MADGPAPFGTFPTPARGPSRKAESAHRCHRGARQDQSPRPVTAAVDGSANGNRALERAVSQALMAGAPLRIVHARLYRNGIGATLAGGLEEPRPDDDPVLIRVREALDGRAGLPRSSKPHPPAPRPRTAGPGRRRPADGPRLARPRR
ncbi:universal stress protein [Streptomyces sp. NPDC006450]|uniref:universal stress protein n=1 Tax=Streptomyces sp. NPDC006450 TaxID=3155458 RepID=UPI0033B46CF6